MIKNIRNFYEGFTLVELLVVISIMVILGGMGMYSFSGLRESIAVSESISNMKADLQRARNAAMLLQRETNEQYWPYGIGIDFSQIETNGTYSFFKWYSNSSTFNASTMGSELIAYDETSGYVISNGNGVLPVPVPKSNITGSTVKFTGFEVTTLQGGFEYKLTIDPISTRPISYVVFEAVTGRAFLYNDQGIPVNYTDASGELVYDGGQVLSVTIYRNQNSSSNIISVSPNSGAVSQTTGTGSTTADSDDGTHTPPPATPIDNDGSKEEIYIPIDDGTGDVTDPVDPVDGYTTDPYIPPEVSM